MENVDLLVGLKSLHDGLAFRKKLVKACIAGLIDEMGWSLKQPWFPHKKETDTDTHAHTRTHTHPPYTNPP